MDNAKILYSFILEPDRFCMFAKTRHHTIFKASHKRRAVSIYAHKLSWFQIMLLTTIQWCLIEMRSVWPCTQWKYTVLQTLQKHMICHVQIHTHTHTQFLSWSDVCWLNNCQLIVNTLDEYHRKLSLNTFSNISNPLFYCCLVQTDGFNIFTQFA